MIRVDPRLLRETAEAIENSSTTIEAEVVDVGEVIEAAIQLESIKGNLGTALINRFHNQQEAMLAWADMVKNFALLLQEAARIFEEADKSPDSAQNTPAPQPTPPANPKYLVKAGDTLWDIAQRYGTTVEELLALNPQIQDRDLIYPGQEIVLPGGSNLPSGPAPSPQMPPNDNTGQNPGAPGSWYYQNGVNPQHPAIQGYARPSSVDANGYGQWGQYNVGQLVRMIDDPNAPWMNGQNNSAERINQIVRYLNPGGPNDPNAPDSLRYQGPPEGTCNGFAKDAMYLMGAPFPYHAAANQSFGANYSVGMQHNWLLANSSSLPQSGTAGTGWYRVSPEIAQSYANNGYPSLQINQGHVGLIVPEPGQSRGGNPIYVAEGGAPSTLSNGTYRQRSGYDYFIYVY